MCDLQGSKHSDFETQIRYFEPTTIKFPKMFPRFVLKEFHTIIDFYDLKRHFLNYGEM